MEDTAMSQKKQYTALKTYRLERGHVAHRGDHLDLEPAYGDDLVRQGMAVDGHKAIEGAPENKMLSGRENKGVQGMPTKPESIEQRSQGYNGPGEFDPDGKAKEKEAAAKGKSGAKPGQQGQPAFSGANPNQLPGQTAQQPGKPAQQAGTVQQPAQTGTGQQQKPDPNAKPAGTEPAKPGEKEPVADQK
jgi:hypothetical protein